MTEARSPGRSPARSPAGESPLVVGGARLETRWYGSGPSDAPVLVFAHEGLGCVSLWRDFPALAAERCGLSAFAWSRAGYGRSDPCTLPRPVSYMHDEGLEVLPRLLDAAGIERAVMVGHSDGASIALIHAGGSGDRRVEALALLAPHVFAEPAGLASIRAAGEAYRDTDLRARLARHHGDNVDCAFHGWHGAWLDPAFVHWNLEDYLPMIEVPVSIVQGEDDEYGTSAQIEAIRDGVRGPCEVRLLPACGHSPWREQPGATLDAIAELCAEIHSPPPAAAGG